MKVIFADTSFYFALLNVRDIAHETALQVGKQVEQPVLLTDFIILELGNAFCGTGVRQLFTRLVADLRSDPDSRIIPASHDLLDRGLELFSRREV